MKPVSELKMTNFAQLRMEVIEKLRKEPTKVTTMTEYQKVINLVGTSSLDLRDEKVVTLLGHLQHDITAPTALPKWAALASWLNPHGLLSQNPLLIESISKILLEA